MHSNATSTALCEQLIQTPRNLILWHPAHSPGASGRRRFHHALFHHA